MHPTLSNPSPSLETGTRFTYPGGMEGWVNLGYRAIERPREELATSHHKSDALTTTPSNPSQFFSLQKAITKIRMWLLFVTSTAEISYKITKTSFVIKTQCHRWTTANMILLNSLNRWQFIKKFWSTEKFLQVFIYTDVFKQWTLKQCLETQRSCFPHPVLSNNKMGKYSRIFKMYNYAVNTNRTFNMSQVTAY